MSETKLKAKLVEKLRKELPKFVIYTHQDMASGIPDLSINGNGRISWWELKFADPDFDSTGIQELDMLRLAANNVFAGYVIYEDIGGNQRTRIVHPKDFRKWDTSGEVVKGINHDWVIEKIKQEHL